MKEKTKIEIPKHMIETDYNMISKWGSYSAECMTYCLQRGVKETTEDRKRRDLEMI